MWWLEKGRVTTGSAGAGGDSAGGATGTTGGTAAGGASATGGTSTSAGGDSNDGAGEASGRVGGASRDRRVHSRVLLLNTLTVYVLLVLDGFNVNNVTKKTVSSMKFKLMKTVTCLFPFIFFKTITFCVSGGKGPRTCVGMNTTVILIVLLYKVLRLVFRPCATKASILSCCGSSDTSGGTNKLLNKVLVHVLYPLVKRTNACIVLVVFSVVYVVLMARHSLLTPLKERKGGTCRRIGQGRRRATRVHALRQSTHGRTLTLGRERGIRALRTSTSSPDRGGGHAGQASLGTSNVAFTAALLSRRRSPINNFKQAPGSPRVARLIPRGRPSSGSLASSFRSRFIVGETRPTVSMRRRVPFSSTLRLRPMRAPTSRRRGRVDSRRTPTTSPVVRGDPRVGRRRSEGDDGGSTRTITTRATDMRRAVQRRRRGPQPICRAPPLGLLGGKGGNNNSSSRRLHTATLGLRRALRGFKIKMRMAGTDYNPSIAECRLRPRRNMGMDQVIKLTSSVGLGLTITSLEVRTPVPNGTTINVRIPGDRGATIVLKSLLRSGRFGGDGSPVSFTINGSVTKGIIIASVTGVPRLLITNTAKSNGSIYVGALVVDIVCGTSPSSIGLVLISPGIIRLDMCGKVPRLVVPIIASVGGTTNTLG